MWFLLAVSSVQAGTISDQVEAAPAVVWAGIDYSRARFFIPETFADPEELVYFAPGGGLGDRVERYEKPQKAWDDLVVEWNAMLQTLVVEDLEAAIKRDVTLDLPAPAGQTQKRTSAWWLSQYEARKSPSDLDRAGIDALVKRYRLKTRAGIGLVFILERSATEEKEACLWPTWFDVQKKTVIQSERVCEKPGGTAFRNYWLGPIEKVARDIVKGLKKGEI